MEQALQGVDGVNEPGKTPRPRKFATRASRLFAVQTSTMAGERSVHRTRSPCPGSTASRAPVPAPTSSRLVASRSRSRSSKRCRSSILNASFPCHRVRRPRRRCAQWRQQTLRRIYQRRPARTQSGMCGRRVRGFAIDLIPELVRSGRAWEVEPGRPETVALSDRLQTAYQRVLEKRSDRRCRIGAEVFVARVSGRPGGRPKSTGDDPRCSTWFP